MKNVVLMSALIIACTSLSIAGEFPRPKSASDIAGIWGATSPNGYVRLVVHENGEGHLIYSGIRNTIDVYTIEEITFGNDPFDFSIVFAHCKGTQIPQSYNGMLWFGGGLLLFQQKTLKPLEHPPVFSFIREATLQTLSEAARTKAKELKE